MNSPTPPPSITPRERASARADKLRNQAASIADEARSLAATLPRHARPFVERFIARWLALELAIINELEHKTDED